jgi:hypothetical protein
MATRSSPHELKCTANYLRAIACVTGDLDLQDRLAALAREYDARFVPP